MKQALIERMEALQLPVELIGGNSMDHRLHRMTREVQGATHHPVILKIFTVGLLIVFALAVLL